MFKGILSQLQGKINPRTLPMAPGGTKAPPTFGSSPKPPPSAMYTGFYTYGSENPKELFAPPEPLRMPSPPVPAANNVSGGRPGLLGRIAGGASPMPGAQPNASRGVLGSLVERLRTGRGYGHPPLAIPGHPAAYAEGGAALGQVSGPGSGRSDEIDARLSDGEYVFDAETVALLGDGSTEAGARRLDQLRENIRRHKGKMLAKGKFSPDARDPETYLEE